MKVASTVSEERGGVVTLPPTLPLLFTPAKGGKRRKYGGTVTRHGFRKGDLVRAEKAGKVYVGWCSGDTAKAVSVSDINWKRLGQFTASKVELLQRSTGLICQQGTKFAGATSIC